MNTVVFRDFEERDVDFIFRCKNDEELNKLIVGEFHPFTYEEAVDWVHGCMGEHEAYKFWAIATNDEEKRIVGWVSLSVIDRINKSACFHGIVIGDKAYNDGFAWIESYLFIMEYVFEKLRFNRLYGSSIFGNKDSNSVTHVFLWTEEGIMRQAIMKNGHYYNVKLSSILRDEYLRYKAEGEYNMKAILYRVKQWRRRGNRT